MKKGTVTALVVILCLFAGIFLGLLFPRGVLPWDNSWTDKLPNLTVPTPIAPVPATQDMATQTEMAEALLNSRDNVPLLNAAEEVILALKEEDFYTLAQWIDPQRGLTFTPYSTVDFSLNLTFTSDQIKMIEADETVYTWGSYDGSGAPIQLTFANYFDTFVYDADYSQATNIAVDKVLITGNSLENVTELYADCRFVEFSYPSRDPDFGGLDWCSLKLVFTPGETDWYLVGIIHSQWTV